MRKLLALIALTAMVAACGDGGAATTTTEGATTTSGPTTTLPTATTSPPAGSTTMAAEGVHLADSSLGQILVDPDGLTLYLFTVDSGGESSCYDTCADNWPAVPADTAVSSSLDSSVFVFGATERTDGSSQLTLNDQPLYYFAGDSAPGDTNGQGLNEVWYVIGANGEMITEAATSRAATTTTAMDGYGY